MANVTMIPAVIQRCSAQAAFAVTKRKVAAYARVSTDSDEQLTSYEAQVDYYTKYIMKRDDWEFIKVYTDEGISATNTKKRDGFKSMVADALAGKIDLIVTKSVSRFARNTVDSLTTVRQLKERGVEIYFEKENIWTLDSKGELLITIMSSLAQEESRSISENVTWGQRKRMADGKVTIPYGRFLGYEKGADGLPKIVESEAETVRLIYKMYLNGGTVTGIAKYLTKQKIPTPGNREVWSKSTVRSILQNEKYSGNAVLQKRFTVDFLTKVVKLNEGEVPQYYVEDSHPAIVSPEVFDLVQDELRRNGEIGSSRSGAHCFSSKIICGGCGSFYGSKTWHSSTEYKRVMWQCNKKYKVKGEIKCDAPHISDDTLKWAFTEAFNRLITEKEKFVSEYDSVIQRLTATPDLDDETEKLKTESAVIYGQLRQLLEENARVALDQNEYELRFGYLNSKYDELTNQLKDIAAEKQARTLRREKITRFLDDLSRQEKFVTEFDEGLCRATLDTVTVSLEKEVVFRFRDGTEVGVDCSGE